MFGFGKKSTPTIPFPLHFKSGEAAVDYASQFMICDLARGVDLPAVVLDAREVFGLPVAVQVRDDGIQLAVIRICGERGGFDVMTQTAGAVGPRLEVGDLVSWRAFKCLAEIGRKFGDERKGWVGIVTGRLKPVLTAEGWVGEAPFHN